MQATHQAPERCTPQGAGWEGVLLFHAVAAEQQPLDGLL
jgi:hypothetical protein